MYSSIWHEMWRGTVWPRSGLWPWNRRLFWVAPSHFIEFVHETFRNCLFVTTLDPLKWTPRFYVDTFLWFVFCCFFCLNLVAYIFTVIRISLFCYAFSPYFLLPPAGLCIFIFHIDFLSERSTFLFLTWTNYPNKKQAPLFQTLLFHTKWT